MEASGALGKKQCEDLIASLVHDHWLQTTYLAWERAIFSTFNSKSGKLMIGPRTAVELEGYLRGESLFEDCSICRTLVVSQVRMVQRSALIKVPKALSLSLKGMWPAHACPMCGTVGDSQSLPRLRRVPVRLGCLPPVEYMINMPFY